MGSNTLQELRYRTFDSLLNDVYVDLPSFTREGMIEPAQLIKVAQKINYELGLKIYSTKETILDVDYGRAKLPSDFHILNLALLCHHGVIYERGIWDGLHSENRVTQLIPNLTTCPCWTVDNPGNPIGTTFVGHDGVTATITFASGITKLCALSIANPGSLTITTNSFCYSDSQSGQFTCDIPSCSGPDYQSPMTDNCKGVNADPWKQNKVFTTCNNTQQVNVIEYHSNQVREYREFEKIYMVPAKEATSFCVNTQFQGARHTGNIKDGFLYIPTLREDSHHYQENREERGHGKGRVYICYLGAMGDEDGNLLVLDHPKINELYEFALKERIFSNIYLDGEPDIERRLHMLKDDLRRVRAECLSIVATPDFKELKDVIERNRKAQYHKYFHPFSSIIADRNFRYNTGFSGY